MTKSLKQHRHIQKLNKSKIGTKHSKETLEKMRKKHKLSVNGLQALRKSAANNLKPFEKSHKTNVGKKSTAKTKRKQREAAIRYIVKTAGQILPRVGKNEKKILDNLEHELGYEIDRKFTVVGYFPDGYIHELNLVIEVDERPKSREKDIEREQIIKKTLNCEFLRIKDYN